MSLSVLLNPNDNAGTGVIPISNCVKWVVQAGANIQTDTKSTTVHYQICDSDGNPLSGVRKIQPTNGLIFSIDFEGTVGDQFRVECPLRTGLGPYEFDHLKIEVVLKYWCVEFDKETCESNEMGEQQDGTYTIINAGDNWFCPFDEGSALNIKPYILELCADSLDWLYFCEPGVVKTTWVSSLGVNFNNAIPYDANSYVGVGPGNIWPNGLPTTPFAPDHVIIEAPGVKYCIRFCCCEDNHIDIHFLSMLGGFSTMSFNETSYVDLNTTQSQVCLNSDWCRKSQSIWVNQSGFRITEKTTFRKYTLKKTFEFPDDEAKSIESFVMDFKSSCAYCIRVFVGKGTSTTTMMPFILDPGSLRYDPDGCQELTVTGYIPIPINKPRVNY